MQPDAQLAQQVLDVQPFSAWLAPKVRHFEPGAVEIELTCRAELTQHHGYVHGGVVSALADLAMAFAGGSVLGDVLTSEFKVSFVRPALGESVIARGRVLHSGRRQATAEALVFVVRDGAELLVAVALGTIVSATASAPASLPLPGVITSDGALP